MADKIRVTFTDITGTKHADVTLKDSLTAEQVVKKLIDNNFLASLDSGQVYTLQNKRTQVTIQPTQTLDNAGVQDGDMLIAGVMTRGG
ncbi:MAG: hypothetical protein UZ14_CFX002001769 [Chloroflexi bacterium OLB14]|nr:MAG: hypothetical protein UZ14_CFX002001769 [Chloroflexi bacterium OLB14]